MQGLGVQGLGYREPWKAACLSQVDLVSRIWVFASAAFERRSSARDPFQVRCLLMDL